MDLYRVTDGRSSWSCWQRIKKCRSFERSGPTVVRTTSWRRTQPTFTSFTLPFQRQRDCTIVGPSVGLTGRKEGRKEGGKVACYLWSLDVVRAKGRRQSGSSVSNDRHAVIQAIFSGPRAYVAAKFSDQVDSEHPRNSLVDS